MSELKPNSLYIILFLTGSGVEPNKFHWGLYLHMNNRDGGTKYHIRQQGSGWIVDHGHTRGPLKSFLLVGLLRIAEVQPPFFNMIQAAVGELDKTINNGGMTCRIWTLGVIERLIAANLVRCQSLTRIEREALDFGNAYQAGAFSAVQPRPLADSTVCQL